MNDTINKTKEKLINKYIKLPKTIADRYWYKAKSKYNITYDELISECYYGLILSVDSMIENNRKEDVTYIRCCINYRIVALFKEKYKIIANELQYEHLKEEVLINDIWQDEVETKILNEQLFKVFDEILTPIESSIISLRFGLADGNIRSQSEVAKSLCIHPIKESKLEKHALMVLRRKLKLFI